jgi:hypothetical protein
MPTKWQPRPGDVVRATYPPCECHPYRTTGVVIEVLPEVKKLPSNPIAVYRLAGGRAKVRWESGETEYLGTLEIELC